MAETWYILNSGECEPAWNMAADEALLGRACDAAIPVLRFYGWTEPAATFGYFQVQPLRRNALAFTDGGNSRPQPGGLIDRFDAGTPGSTIL